MVKKLNEFNNKSNGYEDRCNEYSEYLDNHIANVILAYELCDKESLKDITGLTDDDLIDIQEQIECHDQSKYEDEEWDAYLDWFYPENEEADKDEYAYDQAWIHHCHNNTHHFQYWVCIDDDGTTRPIDMPIECIIEALCDWHSFSAKNSDSSAYKWWQEHKDIFAMTDTTKEWFDKLVELFKKSLAEYDKEEIGEIENENK